ncbi:hypothetical protein Tco_1184073 [Tanacetum coccineum]
MIRLKERRKEFMESVVEDSCESDVDSFVKRKVAEMRKRKRADEFKEMRHRMSSEHETDVRYQSSRSLLKHVLELS